jgi:protein-disulfide isomerase
MSPLIPPVSSSDHMLGDPSAPVILVEYGDYECPYCGEAYPVIKALERHFGKRMSFVFRNFPLNQSHPYAEHAAEAAEAAGAEGQFWPMHDVIYEHQSALDDAHLVRYAEGIGVPRAVIVSALTDHTHASRVRQDFLSGVRSGVNGTPSFFINGQKYEGGYDLASLREAVEEELATVSDQRPHV